MQLMSILTRMCTKGMITYPLHWFGDYEKFKENALGYAVFFEYSLTTQVAIVLCSVLL